MSCAANATCHQKGPPLFFFQCSRVQKGIDGVALVRFSKKPGVIVLHFAQSLQLTARPQYRFWSEEFRTNQPF